MRRRDLSQRLLLLVTAVAWACREPKAKARTAPVASDGAPPGGELAFEREVDGNLDLYLIPAGGGKELRLTDDPAEDGLARFTPDGERILFTSLRTGKYQIYEVSPKG
ncbi:MAG: TolB family protein, partial [Vicinamibacterales bacterium]